MLTHHKTSNIQYSTLMFSLVPVRSFADPRESLDPRLGSPGPMNLREKLYQSLIRVFCPKGRSFTAVLLGMDRCGSFPLLSAPHSLFSIWPDLKKFWKDPRGTNVEVMRVDLANWALRTSPKFTTGLLLLLDFTTLFNISGHQRRFLQWAWKVPQILLRGSNFGLRFFYVP